jgi:hypothetical protein
MKDGRWCSRDPLGEKGGANLFILTQNDCIWHIDLLGLKFYPYKITWWTIFEINVMGRERGQTGQGLILGWTEVLEMPKFRGSRQIDKFMQRNCYCAKVKQNYEYQLIVHEYVPNNPIGKFYTEAGFSALNDHEDRRVEAMRRGFDEYFDPVELNGFAATACGTICDAKPGVAESRLEKYLRDLDKAAREQYFDYNLKEQEAIGAENDTGNFIEADGPAGKLFDGLKKIHKVRQPPKFKMPPCPDNSCGP